MSVFATCTNTCHASGIQARLRARTPNERGPEEQSRVCSGPIRCGIVRDMPAAVPMLSTRGHAARSERRIPVDGIADARGRNDPVLRPDAGQRRHVRHPAMGRPQRGQPGDPAGRTRFRSHRQGHQQRHAAAARRRPARLGDRQPDHGDAGGALPASANRGRAGAVPRYPGHADGRHGRPAAVAAVHGQPARRRTLVGVHRVGPDRGHRPARHPPRRARLLGAVTGPPERTRRGVRRCQRQPGRRGLLAAGRRLHGPLDAARGHPGAARRPAAVAARRGGPGRR